MGHLGWLYKLNLHPRHQHCTDEAQKAETVLSAVKYRDHKVNEVSVNGELMKAPIVNKSPKQIAKYF